MAEKHESKYKKEDRWGELTSCEDPPEFEGAKASNRPKTYCKPVTCLSTLTVNGQTTLDSTTIVPPAVTVGGQTFVPTLIQVVTGVGPEGPNGEAGAPTYGYYTVLAAAPNPPRG
jgi:hypothetical protein